MAQQINLFTPILLTQKRSFSGQTLATALVLFLLAGSGLCAYWVASLNASSEALKRELSSRVSEREALQAAIKMQQASSAPTLEVAQQELRTLNVLLQERRNLLEELQRGLIPQGGGHAARMRLVAQTIPDAVWVTDLLADEKQMEVRGVTTDPSALNDWVGRLAASPLLAGHSLNAVKVEQSRDGNVTSGTGAGVAGVNSAQIQPAWSYALLSAARPAPLVTAGAKP